MMGSAMEMFDGVDFGALGETAEPSTETEEAAPRTDGEKQCDMGELGDVSGGIGSIEKG